MRRRHLEYADRGPFAEAHASFLAETVVPLVENRFRTSGERHVLGSSLGGQASMQLMLKYPHLFDGVACLSPYFQSGTLELVPLVAEKLRSKRIYLDIGGNLDDREVPWLDLMDHMTPENWWNPGYWWLDTQLQPAVESMKEVLETAGIPFYLHQEPGGRHNERAWAQRIDLPLLHLFGKGLKEEAETMINFN
jgi:enterochelin esterase-like enzyme